MSVFTRFGDLTRVSLFLGGLSVGIAALILISLPGVAVGQPQPQPEAQQSADPYTRYELLAPESSQFRIVYDVTATTPGATRYYNPIRVGSEPTVHSVTDLYTGKPLRWKLVEGKEAAVHLRGANLEGEYIEVLLARPVPAGGETRIRIDKTYADPASYTAAEGGAEDAEDAAENEESLVFERSLGIPRNAIVLPLGYELTASSVPVQVAREASGRIKVSFLHRTPGPALVRIAGRKLPPWKKDDSTALEERAQEQLAQERAEQEQSPQRASAVQEQAMPDDAPTEQGLLVERPPVQRPQRASARLVSRPNERAFQDREIVYFLQSPESHSFRLFHDYTEKRPGVDRYLNIVRPGSRASEPSATLLDTGQELKVETLRGEEITERGLDIGEPVTDRTEVVVIWFEAVKAGQSKRLRIWETYTDAGRYGINPRVSKTADGGHVELVWDRSFGRSRNTVVLPQGWWLTESSIPARIDLDEEGRVRLLFENDRPDAIDVLLRARRREVAEQ